MHGFALPFFVFPVGEYEKLFRIIIILYYGNIVGLFDQTYLLRGLCVMRVCGVSVACCRSTVLTHLPCYTCHRGE
jgi:hypothetical protein